MKPLPGVLLTLGAFFGISCAPEEEPTPQWNVVLIVVDTLRADHLRAYGHDRATSPYLDELSRRGMVFQDARAQAGCTFPSVNSLLTSRYPQFFMGTMKEHGWGIPASVPTLAEMLAAQGWSTAAASSSPIIRKNPGPQNEKGGFGAGFDSFDDECERQPASCVNDAAFRQLAALREPFFLYLHYFEPHDPYQPPAEHRSSFVDETYGGKDWVANGSLVPLFKMMYKDGPPVEFDDLDLAHTLDLYDEEILYFDSELERLVERLKSDGVFGRTILVLASDHGEEFMDHDHFFHCKDLSFDTVVKTPLFVWIPGVEGPQAIEGLAQNLDIVPTILDYLRLDNDEYVLEGRSLRPLIEGEGPLHRYVFGMQRYDRFVTDGRFKLMYNIRTEELRLYDLVKDPGERINMAVRRPELTSELSGLLARWMESVEGKVDIPTRVQQATEVTERLRALGYL